MKSLSEFVKERRKVANLTQVEFADIAGVALTVVRKIEQGKTNLNLDKVNQVLSMFGHTLMPIREERIEDNEVR
ncbi:type II toxin-antitoxin system Y4mF family antitoxin [Polaribacter sp. Z014]|uniref:type II toxin-antitoxin system Y4mF family antitoxin n=1 Tax=Polaribacter sp. Z014 TaxID=2927126 RepID=UPI0020224E9E|nr:type II toxin-antitoxin system Y4mF family antitoxin [Polaribacter sp. Z014]MCL7762661.1 type II toxin-antitoxin system Y4mF family antitoxin [Polaribacter sp. Z014]